MSFKNILLAFLCLVSANIFAQPTTIKGKILDGETKEPIVKIIVLLAHELIIAYPFVFG